MRRRIPRLLLLLFFFVVGSRVCSGATNPQDASALRALMSEWQNSPPSWGKSGDPCGVPWEGITCENSRVTMLSLSSVGLKGKLAGDIGQLTALQTLDLSSNKDLGGALTPSIGNLKQLTTLVLSGCSFSGKIPDELGNLSSLVFLALNTNRFSGPIPASLGALSNISWFDLGDNQLTGTIPVSTSTSPGLDLLVNSKHFHLNKNQLEGDIPPKFFSSQLIPLHILLDSNKFTGGVPASVGLVQTLQALRLDNNSLSGTVPSTINNLTNLLELNLANNQFTGTLPNLTGMSDLNYVDMSNNTFNATEVPPWFSTLQSLTTLVIQSGPVHGQLPEELFSFPQLQQVILDNNSINGTFSMGNSLSPQLELVNLQNNDISLFTVNNAYTGEVILVGNPVCEKNIANTAYCLSQQALTPYSTSLSKCGSTSCPPDQSLSPLGCNCAYPYQGRLTFRAPYFHDVTNNTLFQALEDNLWSMLKLTRGSVYLSDPFFDINEYLQVQVKLFPSTGMYFNHTEIIRIGSLLSNQIFKPPPIFGTYFFIGVDYPFPGQSGGSSISKGVIVGIAVGCMGFWLWVSMPFNKRRELKRQFN